MTRAGPAREEARSIRVWLIDVALLMLIVKVATESAGTGTDQGPRSGVGGQGADQRPSGRPHQCAAAGSGTSGRAAPGGRQYDGERRDERDWIDLLTH